METCPYWRYYHSSCTRIPSLFRMSLLISFRCLCGLFLFDPKVKVTHKIAGCFNLPYHYEFRQIADKFWTPFCALLVEFVGKGLIASFTSRGYAKYFEFNIRCSIIILCVKINKFGEEQVAVNYPEKRVRFLVMLSYFYDLTLQLRWRFWTCFDLWQRLLKVQQKEFSQRNEQSIQHQRLYP